jgi:SAM-dependent MidA family methyltransferase
MSRNILPEPPDDLKQLSNALYDRIRDEIRVNGQIPFSRYMELALYEPGQGYYSAGLHKLGESGDFTTSPELGPLFAACLSNVAAELAAELGDYDILEIGAGSGRLAADLLNALAPGARPRRYRILDRSADLRRVQAETLSASAPVVSERVEWLDEPPGEDWQGLIIANEVLDAFPVERFRIAEAGVEQACVREGRGGFEACFRTAPAELESAVRDLESDLEEPLRAGYCSEINLQMKPWLQAVTAKLSRGMALFVDYGYPRQEYYLPERSAGTLMCHYRHRAHGDPYFWPGLQDITAWVDFTALAEAADDCGLLVAGFATQAMFLLGSGLDRELTARIPAAGDEGLALNYEVRQLTLPNLMGERFKAMGLERNLSTASEAFSLQDLRYRL